MKKTRKVLCLSFVLAMLVSTNAYAASISAKLNSGNNLVTTTFNSGKSGYHRVIVSGTEQHSQTGHVTNYSETASITGSGDLRTTHSAHTGYQFIQSYSGNDLVSTVYLGGSFVGQVKVTK